MQFAKVRKHTYGSSSVSIRRIRSIFRSMHQRITAGPPVVNRRCMNLLRPETDMCSKMKVSEEFWESEALNVNSIVSFYTLAI